MKQHTQTRVVIDLGNTLAKVAAFENGAMVSLQVFRTGSYQRLEKYLTNFPERSFCIVSSVVDYPNSFEAFINSHLNTLFLDTNTSLPIKNLYKTPETLGRDRIAAAVAAWHEFPEKNILVIDAGTAITTDLVTKQGEFIGGAIAPGIDMRFRALHTFTSKLPLVKRKNIRYLTGTTTEESISSGVINGVVCEIDGTINKNKAIYPDLITVFGGGDSKFLLKRLKNSIFALSNPVINGLHLILNYNIENNKLI
jgi:type III pantothenate kinase